MHQPGARPPGGRVEARLVGLRAGLAIAGERRIDQPFVQRTQILIGDAEPPPHRRRVVGDEHIGAPDQAIKDRASGSAAQIERQALLVARVENEGGVERPLRHRHGASAIGVAHAGRLDLDDLGAEIRHHRCRRRPGDKAGAVDHLEPVENPFRHRPFPFAAATQLSGKSQAGRSLKFLCNLSMDIRRPIPTRR